MKGQGKQSKARQGKAGHSKSRHERGEQIGAGQGKTLRDKAKQGKAR
jgi:hypothetical protein